MQGLQLASYDAQVAWGHMFRKLLFSKHKLYVYNFHLVMNVSFADVSIEVTEGVGIVDFMLQKTAGALGPVSVQIFTSDGTALGMKFHVPGAESPWLAQY